MGHLGRFTSTPYLVLFVILGGIGITAAFAGGMTIFNQTVVFQENVQMDKALNVDGIFSASNFSPGGGLICGNQYELKKTHPFFIITPECLFEPLIWAKSAGGIEVDEKDSVTTLSDDSVIVAGTFDNGATFGEGEPNETVLTVPGFNQGIFLARYNPDGTLAWARADGGDMRPNIRGITTLSDDSVVIIGDGSATFGVGDPNETVISGLSIPIFLARYDSGGTLIWAKSAQPDFGVQPTFAPGITTLSDDSMIITGFLSGTTTFGPGDPNETILTDALMYLARYNSDGTLAWARQDGGSNGFDVTTLSDGSVVVTGTCVGTTTFGTGDPNQTDISCSNNLFLARYNSDGTLVWAVNSISAGIRITTLSDDSVVVTGDNIVARFSSAGTLLWLKNVGQDGVSVTALSDDSVVVTGTQSGTTIFGAGEPNQTVFEGNGLFVARYNSDGSLKWAKSASSTGVPQFSHLRGYHATTLSDDSVVVTGSFRGTATFGPGEPNQTVLDTNGDFDLFIARYGPT